MKHALTLNREERTISCSCGEVFVQPEPARRAEEHLAETRTWLWKRVERVPAIKGHTTRELAQRWGITRNATRRYLARLVTAGHVLADRDTKPPFAVHWRRPA